jgi:hypothetical protein
MHDPPVATSDYTHGCFLIVIVLVIVIALVIAFSNIQLKAKAWAQTHEFSNPDKGALYYLN